MDNIALQASVFFGIGVAIWALSRHFGMAEYGAQPVQPFDRWYLFASLGLAVSFDVWCKPLLEQWIGLADVIGHAQAQIALWHPLLQVVGFLVTTDFLAYWAHRWMHTRIGWRFHLMHHSPRSLNWWSGMRGSPVHCVLILAPSALMGVLFLHAQLPVIVISMLLVSVLSQHLTHSNLRLPFERQIEWLVVTPRMHFLHHHRDPRYGSSNYGFYFSIWDHLFGTYIDARKVPGPLTLGIDDEPPLLTQFLGFSLRLGNLRTRRMRS